MLNIMSSSLKHLVLASSLALAGCWNLSYISTIENPKIALNNPYNKIEDNSNVGKYFLSDKRIIYSNPLTIDEIINEVHGRTEYSASSYFGRKVEFAKPYYVEAGARIILANRGELGIIGVQSVPFYQFTPGQREKAQYYAERNGLDVPLHSLDEHLYSLDEKIKGEPMYAAYVSDLGGFAFSLLFTHIIVADNNWGSRNRNLYGSVSLLAHEATHHLIETAEPFFQLPVIFYPNERMDMVETACDVIADMVALQFEKDHLLPASRLYADFVNSRKRNETALEVWQTMVERFEAIPLRERRKNRDAILTELSDYASRQFGASFEVNEANLSLAKRYGGERERYNQMKEIADTIGPTKFILLVSDIYNDAELEFAHHYVVHKGLQDVNFLRDYFRREDANWPAVLR